jgi:hypothetical protein
MGQIIKTERLEKNAGTIAIDIASFAAGMYYYRLEAGNGHSVMMKMMIGR